MTGSSALPPRRGRRQALAGRQFVIDGSNVLLLHGRRKPDLRYLLAICDYILEQGGSFECFFDANIAYILRDHRPTQLVLFTWLLAQSRPQARFHTAPSGTQADALILERAREQGGEVISNDRFRDRARSHRWIWKRRHPVSHADDLLLMEKLGARLTVDGAALRYMRRSQGGWLSRRFTGRRGRS